MPKNLDPLLPLLILFWFSVAAIAQDSGSSDDAAQANNPLANFKAFNVQNYFVPTLSGGVEGSANTFWFRYAQPVGRLLLRASLPLNRFPTGSNQHESGLGDFGVFAAYLIDTGNPSRSFGIGPQLSAPTATEDALGSGKWQAGLATVYFDASSPTIQWGGLVTWQTDFAGDSARDDTNFLAVQPFTFVQLGNGLYMRGAPIWAFNLESGNYHVPIGLGIGKVVSAGNVVYNFFIEPQFTILDRGPGQPEIQFYMALNMQFK
jgi:hypothetical protein